MKVVNKLVRECAHIDKCPECSYFKQTAIAIGACLKYNRYIEFSRVLPTKTTNKEGEDEKIGMPVELEKRIEEKARAYLAEGIVLTLSEGIEVAIDERSTWEGFEDWV